MIYAFFPIRFGLHSLNVENFSSQSRDGMGSVIVSIFNSGKSFRTISIMSFLLKIIEMIVNKHIPEGRLGRFPFHSNL